MPGFIGRKVKKPRFRGIFIFPSRSFLSAMVNEARRLYQLKPAGAMGYSCSPVLQRVSRLLGISQSKVGQFTHFLQTCEFVRYDREQ